MRRAASEASLGTLPNKSPPLIPPARYAAAVASKLGQLGPLPFGGRAMWDWDAAYAAAAAAADEQAAPVDPERWSVYVTSDIHTDFKDNMAWVERLPVYGPKTALIVAGDVATSLVTIHNTLLLLKKRFQEVFYCPGNHDLWVVKGVDAAVERMEGGLNSVNKMLYILDLCRSIGVRVGPCTLGGGEHGDGCVPGLARAPVEGGAEVGVVPLFSWYVFGWSAASSFVCAERRAARTGDGFQN